MKALLFLCLVVSHVAFAQSVSISPNQGVKFPRYSTAYMLAIANPETGSTIFNTETNTLWTYLGSAWKNLGGAGSGAMIQTFIFNSLSWVQVNGGYSRNYTATINITEIDAEVLNSGTVEVAYVPPFSSSLVFRKLPEPNWTTNFGGTDYYPITKTFSYELNTISIMINIPAAVPSAGDVLGLPQQIKVTLISPNTSN